MKEIKNSNKSVSQQEDMHS